MKVRRQTLAAQYGSRRGFLKTSGHRVLNGLGYYQSLKKIDWSNVERLVFVCKGNICRSAFAEAVARSHGVEAISCGVDTIENAPANTGAIQMAKDHGFDLTQHKTRPVGAVELRETDLLLAMEPWHIDMLQKHLTQKHQYSLLGLWLKPALPHLHDPYGLSSAYFDQCFSNIEKAVDALIVNLR